MRGCGTLLAARASFLAFVVGSLWAPGVAFSATKHPAPNPKLPFAYDTSGIVNIGADPASVSGPAVLQFQGVTNASFDPLLKTPQVINLGQFVVEPSTLIAGQATTYSDTPFEVQVQTPEFNKTNTVPVLDKIFPTFGKQLDLKTVIENSLLLKGHLDGTVGANGQVNIVATVDSIKLGSINSASQDNVTHYAFPIRFSQFNLPPSWVLSATSTSVTTSSPSTAPNTITTSSTTIPATTTTTIAPAPAAEMLIATSVTPTPEPSTIAFFAVALGGLVLGRRRLRPR